MRNLAKTKTAIILAAAFFFAVSVPYAYAGEKKQTVLTAASAKNADKSITFAVRLTDAEGVPLSLAEVRLFHAVSLFGVDGSLEIGRAETGKNGSAEIRYVPHEIGTETITVRFEGTVLYAPAEQQVVIQVDTAKEYHVATKGLDTVRYWMPIWFVATVLGVWATFGYVIFQIMGIRRYP